MEVKFLSQVYGSVPSHLRSSVGPTTQDTINEVDYCFDCSASGPSYLINPKWPMPWQNESNYKREFARLNFSFAPVDQRRQIANVESEQTNYDVPKGMGHPIFPTNTGKNMDSYTDTMYVVLDDDHRRRIHGPELTSRRTDVTQARTFQTGKKPYFYVNFFSCPGKTRRDCIWSSD